MRIRRKDGPRGTFSLVYRSLFGFASGYGGFGGLQESAHPYVDQAYGCGQLSGPPLYVDPASPGARGTGLVVFAFGAREHSDGSTEAQSDLAPLVSILKAGSFAPGTLRCLRGVASYESPGG